MSIIHNLTFGPKGGWPGRGVEGEKVGGSDGIQLGGSCGEVIIILIILIILIIIIIMMYDVVGEKMGFRIQIS